MLEVNNITHYFGGLTALSEVSFIVESNKIFGIIGPNGAGKTTLFNCITSLYHPSKGTVVFEGKTITGLKPHNIARLGITRTFQHTQVFPEITVNENILSGQHLIKIKDPSRSKQQMEQAAQDMLKYVGIEQYKDQTASSLSMGYQTRLAIGVALSAEPKMLLLDEPAAGMNPEETNQLMELIRDIRSKGLTVVLIEHDMKTIMGLCDRIVVLEYGRKISEGTPEEIRNDSRVIEAYLGREEIA